MLTGQQIRHQILDGFETGRLWQLAYEHAKLHGETDGGMPCHVCDQTIPRGQVYALCDLRSWCSCTWNATCSGCTPPAFSNPSPSRARAADG